MFNNFIGGGQVFLHKIRMFMQARGANMLNTNNTIPSNLLKLNASNKILVLLIMLVSALVIFKGLKSTNSSSAEDLSTRSEYPAIGKTIERLSASVEITEKDLSFCKGQKLSELTCVKLIKVLEEIEAFAKKLDSFQLGLLIQHATQEEFDQYDISFCKNLNLYGDKSAVEAKRMNELLSMLEERATEINRMAY